METKAKLGANAIGPESWRIKKEMRLRNPKSPYNRVFDPEKCSLRP